MTMRMSLFAVSVSALLIALTLIVWLAVRRTRLRSQASWQSLVGRLRNVNHDSIARVALDLESDEEQDEESSLTDAQIWDLVGGLRGLEVLELNCDVLIDMAAYVQHWHPEAVVVAEQLRISARQIRWHVARLQGAKQGEKLEVAFASYAQNAVAIYYAMTQTLLQLYETSNLPESASLRTML